MTKVADVDPTLDSAVAVGGKLVFYGATTAAGGEPWVTDGTPAGTKMLADLSDSPYLDSKGAGYLSPTTLMPVPLGPAGEKLAAGTSHFFYEVYSEALGEELWISDGTAAGTAAGTRLAGDLRAGKASSSPMPLGRLGKYVYFAADDGVHGAELWRYLLP